MRSRLLILSDTPIHDVIRDLDDVDVVIRTLQTETTTTRKINEILENSEWDILLRVPRSEQLHSEAICSMARSAIDTTGDVTFGLTVMPDGSARAITPDKLRHALRAWNAIPTASIVNRNVLTKIGVLRDFESEEIAWWDFWIRAAHAGLRFSFCANASVHRRKIASQESRGNHWSQLAEMIRLNPCAFERPQREWAHLLRLQSDDKAEAQDALSLVALSFPRLLEWDGWYLAALEFVEAAELRGILSRLSPTAATEWRKLKRRLHAFNATLDFERHVPTPRMAIEQKTTPKIGIDIRALSVPSTRNRGIGRYIVCTLRALLAQGSSEHFVLLGEDEKLDVTGIEDISQHPNVFYRAYANGCDKDLDCFLLTDPSPVMRGRQTRLLPVESCPWGSIVYDLIPLEFPDQYLASDTELLDDYLDNLRTLAERCRLYFPISKYVGSQLEAFLKLPVDDIRPIYGGSSFSSDGTPPARPQEQRKPFFLYVGGADSRKNITRLIAAFAHFRAMSAQDIQLVLAGEMTGEKTRTLLARMRLNHLSDKVVGLGSVDDGELTVLYSNAVATIFVSLSEGLGLPALEAMACGCPVIGSNNSALGETIGEAGLLVDPHSVSEIARAMQKLAASEPLRTDLIQRGKKRAAEWTWDKVATELLQGLRLLSSKPRNASLRPRKMQVAMLNRENVWTAPGGDGEVMKQMREAAAKRDIEITFRERVEQGGRPDIVHFVNLTLARRLNQVAVEARSVHAPLVITTLFEDWPLYMRASQETSAILMEYARGKLDRETCDKLLSKLSDRDSSPNAGSLPAVEQASALLSCGESESVRLRSAFPSAQERIHAVPFAVREVSSFDSHGCEQIKEKLGMERFVLCCGRLETRKNQLLLLRALEDEEIGVVLAAGGYTPQPVYADAVRAYQRRGKTLVLGRLERRSLDALMNAATAHALPSFYELPGLVHLEAALAGTKIVASTWGALTDYLPANLLHACDPRNPQSVRSAVNAALNSESSRALADYAGTYTIERLADNLLNAYESALKGPKFKTAMLKNKTNVHTKTLSERGEVHAFC